jgi:hypothetical protein
VVCCFDFGHHRSGIYSFNPAPGNPLDLIHSFNRLYRYSIRFKVTYNAYDFPMNNPSAVSFPPLFEIYRMNGNLTKADLYPKSDQLS